MVGVVTWPVWQDFRDGISEQMSLTPPKYSYRLPFFADVRDDSSRLTRTSGTNQEIIYRLEGDVTRINVYSAFNDAETCNPSNDIAVAISSDGAVYTPLALEFRIINYATNWQKVMQWIEIQTTGTRYVKILITKTDGTVSNPQIMRIEINYKMVGTDHPHKSVFIDNMNDFSKMYSHSPDLSFAVDIPSHYRLVTGVGYSQANVDQQILYAKSAHIDYFAVVSAYPLASVQVFTDLLRTSPYKNDVKYCLIIMFYRNMGESWSARVARSVDNFRDSNYVKVLNGRPLVYFFDTYRFGYTDTEINELRAASISAGIGDPYLVGMPGYPGMDAGSSYLPGGAGVEIVLGGEDKTIPCVGFGINYAPRNDNPPAWGGGAGGTEQSELNGSEMASYVNDGIKWCFDNQASVPAWSILINAWDEFCESAAWLCPTRDPITGLPNTSRLDSVGKAIKSWEPSDTTPPTDVTLNGPSVKDQTITLSWNAASDPESGITNYQIYRGTTANPTVLYATVGNVLAYQDRTGIESTTFHYRVKAVNDADLTSLAFSNDVSATTAQDTVKPVVIGIQSLSDSAICVTFSEKVEQATAEDKENYTVNSGIQVKAAALQSDQSKVVLFVSTLSMYAAYSFHCADIRDQASISNTMDIFDTSVVLVKASSSISLTADNVYELYVNGLLVGTNTDWRNAEKYSVDLKQGQNVIAVKGVDWGAPGALLGDIVCKGFHYDTDAEWKISTQEQAGWNSIDFNDAAWMPATEVAAYGDAPWNSVTGIPVETDAKWIWSADTTGTVYFRYVIDLPGVDIEPVAVISEGISLVASPNPFNPAIIFQVSGIKRGMELKVLNINGRVMADLTKALNRAASGRSVCQVTWNAECHASGVYLVLLRQGNVEFKRKVMLVR